MASPKKKATARIRKLRDLKAVKNPKGGALVHKSGGNPAKTGWIQVD
jgi:hypothetical protein